MLDADTLSRAQQPARVCHRCEFFVGGKKGGGKGRHERLESLICRSQRLPCLPCACTCADVVTCNTLRGAGSKAFLATKSCYQPIHPATSPYSLLYLANWCLHWCLNALCQALALANAALVLYVHPSTCLPRVQWCVPQAEPSQLSTEVATRVTIVAATQRQSPGQVVGSTTRHLCVFEEEEVVKDSSHGLQKYDILHISSMQYSV